MTLTQMAPPYPIFTDRDGFPLDAGYLYFGEVNQNPETNPIQIYYDSAFTIPAAQPLRTSNGYVMRNGSPALVYADSQFSVTVRNKKSELVIYSSVGYGITPGTAATLTDQMTYDQGDSGSVLRVLTSRLQDFVSVKDFGATGDGVTDDKVAIQAAIASGNRVYVPDGTYIVGSAITGAYDVDLYGPGTLSASSNLFEVDGNVSLDGLTLTSPSGFVVQGLNNTGLVDYKFTNCSFTSCLSVVKWVTTGSTDFTVGVGINDIFVSGCHFSSGLGISFHVEARIGSARWVGNDWKNQKYAAVWIGATTRNRQLAISDIVISNNTVSDVTSASSLDTAATAFQVQCVRANITDNIISNVSTIYGVSSGVEVWGIYTKIENAVISGNVVSEISSDNTADNALVSYIQVKGESQAVPSVVTGYNVVVSNNVLKKTANAYSVGVGIFADNIIVSNNIFEGIADAVKSNAGEETRRISVLGNKVHTPPASHKDNAFDMRFDGGRHQISQNEIGIGYVNGIRIRPQTNNVEFLQCVGNDIECSGDAFLLDSTSGTEDIDKLVISGGVISGAYAVRWADINTPDFSFLDVDVSNVTNKFLFIDADEWFRGQVRCWVNLTTTSGSSVNGPFLTLGNGTIASIELHGLGISTDETTYLDHKIIETWRGSGGTVAQLGVTTTVHNVNSGGTPPSVDLNASGQIVIARANGVAAKTTNIRIMLDAKFSPAI